MKEQISLSKEDLIRETAKFFEFNKVDNNVDIAMRRGAHVAVEMDLQKKRMEYCVS